jgi:hypothetical protein
MAPDVFAHQRIEGRDELVSSFLGRITTGVFGSKDKRYDAM